MATQPKKTPFSRKDIEEIKEDIIKECEGLLDAEVKNLQTHLIRLRVKTAKYRFARQRNALSREENKHEDSEKMKALLHPKKMFGVGVDSNQKGG